MVIDYGRSLKNTGHPFSKTTSDKYSPLSPEIYQNTISGRPEPGTKSNIFLQIAHPLRQQENINDGYLLND